MASSNRGAHSDIGSQSELESEEFAETLSAVSSALMKALMMTLTGMFISTLFLALRKSELMYQIHPGTRRTWHIRRKGQG